MDSMCWTGLQQISARLTFKGLCKSVLIQNSDNWREDFHWHRSNPHQAVMAQEAVLPAGPGWEQPMEFIIAPAMWEHGLTQIKATKLGSKCCFPLQNVIWRPTFKNRYCFLSATGDAQPFIKGCQRMVWIPVLWLFLADLLLTIIKIKLLNELSAFFHNTEKASEALLLPIDNGTQGLMHLVCSAVGCSLPEMQRSVS